MNHRPEDLVTLFNRLFRETRRTELVRGGEEPEYLPASSAGDYARVVFAHGYFASALHEISHWCIAGAHRRTLPDYGYWYCPDGRTSDQQREFEKVEVKPQALEWLFAVACRSRFHISVDNLEGGGAIDEDGFHGRVFRQACYYLENGLPERAGQFLEALREFYGTDDADFRCWHQQNIHLAANARGQAHYSIRDNEAYDAIT
ncbi:elongation factor P hydroxylase [Marinobacter daqiaonensis]|nr:elongation factor P hydroxylase [Marinobacter daqiaonensis]